MGLFDLADSTVADQRLYLDSRLVDVECLDCSVRVGVKKNSPHHTCVQWRDHGVEHCPEFSRTSRATGGRHIADPCPRLSDSIERAVAEGRIQIGAIDGY
ncbi:MAG TPA: hypothetical protein PKK40_11575 [Marmoricola sp.]|mgnify:FL=1|nr:hypothetical protein [Marmoricola sp.]